MASVVSWYSANVQRGARGIPCQPYRLTRLVTPNDSGGDGISPGLEIVSGVRSGRTVCFAGCAAPPARPHRSLPLHSCPPPACLILSLLPPDRAPCGATGMQRLWWRGGAAARCFVFFLPHARKRSSLIGTLSRGEHYPAAQQHGGIAATGRRSCWRAPALPHAQPPFALWRGARSTLAGRALAYSAQHAAQPAAHHQA